jgi:hypothetical protein
MRRAFMSKTVRSMNNKKTKASGRVPVDALHSANGSMIVLDCKGELAAVMSGNAKRKQGSVAVVNPFLVLSPDHIEICRKAFRHCMAEALNDLMKAERKGPHGQQRKSQRAY